MTTFLILETLLLLGSAPFLLFPTVHPVGTLAALLLPALWWLLRPLLERRPLPATPFNGALLLWGMALGVGVGVTAFPELTLPKATGLLLGLAAWRYLVLVVTDRRRLRWAVAGFIVVGLVIAAVGVLSARWGAKVPGLAPLLQRLPPQLLSLPEAPDAGVSANQLAGALALYLPLALAGLLAALQAGADQPGWRRGILMVGALLGLILVAGLLLLTQSRSGWMGGAVGTLVLLVLWAFSTPRRWARWGAGVAVVTFLLIGAIVYMRVGGETLGLLWEDGGTLETEFVGRVSLSGRVEIWSRAFYAIQDFPFTGCGLGTFREVVWILYPLFTISPATDIAHAHNIFLQVAVDVGLPGLLAYLALLGIAGAVGWRVARQDVRLRPLALALLASLVALHVYGLTDALAPGSKPGLLFWLVLGLLAALFRLDDREVVPRDV